MSDAVPIIEFRVRWIDSVEGESFTTLAAIGLVVDGGFVWPVSGEDTNEFHWFADELLAHLTECWKPLVLRQTYPIAIQPQRPSFVMADAERRWSSMPSSSVESEQQALAAFIDVHNLTHAFGGVTGLLPLWFLRDQSDMLIDTRERQFRVPIEAAVKALSNVGDFISDRLLQTNKEKWSKLVDAWKLRGESDKTTLLAFTIGTDKRTAAALIEESILEAPASFYEASNDNNEQRMAARMAGPLPIHQIKSVVETIRSSTKRNAPRLAEAQLAALAFLVSNQLDSKRPHVQGSEVAKWLRRHLNLSDHRRVDPFAVLERYNVDVRAIDFRIPDLEAIAVWGEKFGPGVLLNKTSRRVGMPLNFWRNGVARVTAAHELCHLLLDAEHSLSAVDILGSRMSLRIEQRANAFAAEFLLPEQEADAVWTAQGRPLDPEALNKVLRTLCQKHNVSQSIAAWQLEHGGSSYGGELLARTLQQLVPQR
ncbi:hypothetical protein UP09_34195 [Bradyrhizobium sp. LTSP885]|uniref:ImmA/IrrE family metallo-endopeptidase n=1 Tax=Bradyrhizobium sp. LTSP885 TaxID=1619232 RepID=UPI0005CAB8B2|nr:ImmA/IrrE family metallo-endopeptidase [Bradyrhizobium sp. LTSP885]KJC33542.1 hypothetical protein UP09_34195 [Bradyrhizobium sp. LTSP885]